MKKLIEKIVVLILVIIEIFESPLNIKDSKFEFDLLSEINNQRLFYGLNELELSFELCDVAQIRAEEISEKWSHERSNGTKFDVLIQGREWSIAGENLAKFKGDCTSNVVVAEWMNSDSHRKNILNPKFTQCGIGGFVFNDVCYVALVLSD